MPHPTGGVTPPLDYGLDAPGVVRNLFLAAAAGVMLAALVWAGVVPSTLSWRPRPELDVRLGMLGLGLGPGLAFLGAAVAMVWSSRRGKLSRREWLLDCLPWSGREEVLDVGCGRG